MTAERPYQFIEVIESGAQSTVRFRPAINLLETSAADVLAEVTAFVGAQSCQKLIVDVTATPHLPSSIIGVLASISARGVDVYVVGASEDLASILKIMGLRERLHVNQSPLEATSVRKVHPREDAAIAILEGYVVQCRHCGTEQNVSKHSIGKSVECSKCSSSMHVNLSLIESARQIFSSCPKCSKQVVIGSGDIGASVQCPSCGASLVIKKFR